MTCKYTLNFVYRQWLFLSLYYSRRTLEFRVETLELNIYLRGEQGRGDQNKHIKCTSKGNRSYEVSGCCSSRGANYCDGVSGGSNNQF